MQLIINFDKNVNDTSEAFFYTYFILFTDNLIY